MPSDKDEAAPSCYNCGRFFESYFCGYIQSHCDIYGSLDCDQRARHPDTAGATCPRYQAGTPRLIERKGETPPQMINGITENEFIALLDKMDKEYITGEKQGGAGNAI